MDDYTQRKKNILSAIITLTPFVAFWVIAYAPWWVSAPFTILATLYWFGALFLMAGVDGDKK